MLATKYKGKYYTINKQGRAIEINDTSSYKLVDNDMFITEQNKIKDQLLSDLAKNAKYEIGLEFHYYYNPVKNKIVKYYNNSGVLMYELNDRTLLHESDIDNLISKQKEFTQEIKNQQQKEIEAAEAEEKRKKELEEKYKYLNQYLENFTKLQSGKIKKTLEKRYNYTSIKKNLARFEYIEYIALNYKDSYVEHKKFSNMYNKRAKNDYTYSYCLYDNKNDNDFLEVTKTEKLYFEWLKDSISA